ncbi:protease inhibitor I42 family protein [Methylocystis parvus]|uniref:protease inhibitor I42 family protein n=1 Tax=Methylocystis parvus TaxID=134 RepID=UPI003C75512F
MERHLTVAAVVLFAMTQGAAAETLRLAPGESAPLQFSENPSTGYGWRIDPQASVALDRVQITDEGHKPGADKPGAPGTHSWVIRAVAPGKGRIVFTYQRPWEPKPAKTRQIDFVVGPT